MSLLTKDVYNPSDLDLINFNFKNIQTKVVENLLGICQGIIADGSLNESEILFLRQWIASNDFAQTHVIGKMISHNIETILEDGIVEPEELLNLKLFLETLIGNCYQTTGEASGRATRLPITEGVSVQIPERTFCFTGCFAYGTRESCIVDTVNKGGQASKNVTKSVHYLVVGLDASDSWANSAFGRKIEKALEMQQSGHDIAIIDEPMWFESLQAI
jgi:NAD-dependent DNA ligase